MVLPNGKRADAIRFYDVQGVWLQIDQGWLEHCASGYHGHDMVSMNIDPVLARKENLGRKDHYYVSIQHALSWKGSEYCVVLYIYLPRNEGKKFLAWEDEETKCFYTEYVLPIAGEVLMPTGFDHLEQVVYEKVPYASVRIVKYAGEEKTAHGDKSSRLADEMNEVLGLKGGRGFSSRDVSKLLQKFDISRK